MSNSDRIEWIDVAKGIGIIIVLIYHCTPDGYLKNFLWQMHMPLFAFLSGIVFKQLYAENIANMKGFIIKRIKTIYLPFIKYSLCFLCLHNIFFRINFIGIINGNTLYTLR